MEGGGFLIILVGMFAVMYFLLIRPQKAKQRAMQDMLSRIGPGDEVITIGGIYGDVIDVSDDKVVLEIAEDVHIEVSRKAIAQLVPPETEFADDEHELEPTEESAFGEEAGRDAGEALPEPEPLREEKRRSVFGRRSG